jgi:hypothetical protein
MRGGEIRVGWLQVTEGMGTILGDRR